MAQTLHGAKALLIPGLVSVTYRQLPPDEILKLASAAGLSSIEWGGDIHVPHGDLTAARHIGQQTLTTGLACGSYGSYYRLGEYQPNEGLAERVIETAATLGAPSVRVWAGTKGSEAARDQDRARIIDDAQRFATLAEPAGLAVVIEYHANTLTDNAASAIRLHNAINHPAVSLGWQAPNAMDDQQRLADLDRVIDRVTDIHVFHWRIHAGSVVRHPLADARQTWSSYLQRINRSHRDHRVMLEFVPHDDPDRLTDEAAVLIDLIQACSDHPS